ncbi:MULTISPECIES: ABC transporter permease [Staphylococcus]|uniref:ABC transporter permease n=1 Tax=Staphylococcus TaxID=1279 RepID=UPI0021A8CFB6|nr:ABC transporter permease [Staphylococcus epidermidis]MCT1513170.1 ABC transporter permease [Staphylococcus epidermidis]
MSIIYIVAYDIKSILKSYLTYISLAFIIFLTFTFVISLNSGDNTVNGNQILRLSAWTFSFVGILFIVKTLVRDFSQGTIQKYLNTKNNRLKYFISKCISILLLYFFFSIIISLFTYFCKIYVHASSIHTEDWIKFLIILFLFFIVFSLILFFITLLSDNAAIVFSFTIFTILIIPMLLNFIPLLPKYGEKIMDFINYFPITFLPLKLYQGDFSLEIEQTLSSLFFVFIFLVIDSYYIIKKNT